eukprot:6367048-Pyramimonas_sp.AAC.1
MWPPTSTPTSRPPQPPPIRRLTYSNLSPVALSRGPVPSHLSTSSPSNFGPLSSSSSQHGLRFLAEAVAVDVRRVEDVQPVVLCGTRATPPPSFPCWGSGGPSRPMHRGPW